MSQNSKSSNSVKCAFPNDYQIIKSIFEKYEINKFKIFIQKDLVKQSKSTEEINKNGYYTKIIGISYKIEEEEYFEKIQDLVNFDIPTLFILGLPKISNYLRNLLTVDYYVCALNVVVAVNSENKLTYKFDFRYYNENFRRFVSRRLFEKEENIKILVDAMKEYQEKEKVEYLEKVEKFKEFNEKIEKSINENLKIETINKFTLDLKDKNILLKPIDKKTLFDKFGNSILYYFNEVCYCGKSGFSNELEKYKAIIGIQTKDKIYTLNDIMTQKDDKFIIPCIQLKEKQKLISFEYLIKVDESIILSNYSKLDKNENEIDEESTKIINEKIKENYEIQELINTCTEN